MIMIKKPTRSVKSKWKKEVECNGNGNSGDGCGAIYLVREGDLRFYNGNNGYVVRDSAVVMRCPNCNTLTDIDRYDWPVNAYQLKPFSKKWANFGIDDLSTEQWRKYRKEMK